MLFCFLDLPDTDDDSVGKKLHLISLLPKSRASRVLNSWSHPRAICVRARQHSSDLLHGVVSQSKKSSFVTNRKWKGTRKNYINRLRMVGYLYPTIVGFLILGDPSPKNDRPLDTFFKFLTFKGM